MLTDIDIVPWNRVFRDVACDILESTGYTYSNHDGFRPRKMDRIMRDEVGKTVLVQVYHYDFREVDAKVIHNASHNLYIVMRKLGIKLGVLLFSARRPVPIVAKWQGEDGSTINHIGVLELQAMVVDKPDLRARFEDYLHRRGFELVGQTIVPAAKEEFDPAIAITRGSDLAARLENCRPGKGDAPLYEALCTEAINLLFGSQIELFNTQFMVDQGLSRIDYLVTLNTRNWDGFWRDLGTFFNCRYVVLEFKNYTDAIGQDEVTSTAKYLNPKALRSVAIVVARNGEDKNAEIKRHQLLRGDGSLILLIDGRELNEMLNKFDQGYDPSEALSKKLHGLLTALSK